MKIQGINIAIKSVFDFYAKKYDIYRDLYDQNLAAIEFRNVKPNSAELLKTNILDYGALCYKVLSKEGQSYDLLALGPFDSYEEFARHLMASGSEDIGHRTVKFVKNLYEYEKIRFLIKNKTLDFSEGLVMGILNITPDSFYDGGKYNTIDAAIKRAEQIVEEGGDIIDIGAESSRPGSERISIEEEINRLMPVLKEIRKKFPDVFISIDTYKYEVAKLALEEGADLINDIYAGRTNDKIFSLVSSHKAGIILMHMQGDPENMQNNPYYEEPVSEIYDFLYERANLAFQNGVDNIIIDPGIGFGKRVRDNLEIINRLNEFKGLGYPILIGLSNKSFIGKLLNLEVNQREIPTIICETVAFSKGAKIIRTHNVKNAVYLKKIFANLKSLPAF